MTFNTFPRILLIDSYDSFTHNLAALCRRAIPGCHVHIIKNDAVSLADLIPYLGHFSAIVVGPGPGSPLNAGDVGLVKELWSIPDEHILPVFGVCLGLQSLAVECGATLKRLRVVKHGQISRIEHDGREIFKSVGEVCAVRYHSLHVDITGCTAIQPLAWADDGEENGRVLMAAKHIVRPFWAVQYHPESVCTSGGGVEVLRNFWRLAINWASANDRYVRPWNVTIHKVVGPAWPTVPLTSPPQASQPTLTVSTRVLELPGLAVATVCEMLGVGDDAYDFALLDSAAQPGRFSIVGCLGSTSTKISYTLGQQHVRLSTEAGGDLEHDLGSSDVWDWLASFMRTRSATGGVEDIPFWGGLIGYLSYELGVQSLATTLVPQATGRHPDVNLVFVERSIVLDSKTGKIYVQSLSPDDQGWLDKMALRLQESAVSSIDHPMQPVAAKTKTASTSSPVVVLPDRERYISRINAAKEYLLAGDSYELCLTAPTRIYVPKAPSLRQETVSSSWKLYKILRGRNAAPHAAYLRLHPSTLLSSSPERFLSYSRPTHSTCQLRPIKGTVRKGPGITRAVAEQLLAGSNKEVAENLMIVDLIRHDLHGVVGDDVEVKQFCKVEEYKTVWQLVSVIEGKLPHTAGYCQNMDLGWEVLRKSLPPGSMTGAPKKRSVEILHTLEDHDRGIYSGVFGYWCVGGGGDWSVTIRSCFKHDDATGVQIPKSNGNYDSTHDVSISSTEEWTLGAGGAITALSDPEAEWEEMAVKVESVTRAFGDVRFA